MSQTITGGCLCGQVRYEARGEPTGMGFCCCGDCRKASGSGFIAFMNFSARDLTISGETLKHRGISIRGTEALRNSCAACGSLVYGGEYGADDDHTIYAGTLDDPARFRPQIVIFNRDRPDWVALPSGLTVFGTMPGL